MLGANRAVVYGQFLEVGQNGQGKLGAPAVAAKLVGRAGVRADVDAALLRFGVELGQGPDAKGVIRGLLLAFHVEAVFGNDFPVLRRDHRRTPHVPAQRLEEGVDEHLANVGFLDAGGEERLPIGREVPAQLGNFLFALVKGLAHASPFDLRPLSPGDIQQALSPAPLPDRGGQSTAPETKIVAAPGHSVE